MAFNFVSQFNIISASLNLDLIDKIGSGGFGTVFKVIDKLADQVYAVKQINFKDSDSRESVLKEVKTLAKINGSQVVRYNHSWIENNCVFIKMEFCSTNLTDLLKEKSKCFGRQPLSPINIMDYYISYQLFKEVVECVQYLHELNPPIIHRDLKPQNILATNEPINGRYFKLCDFGLATIHDRESISHSVGVGTFRYRAPEVSSSRKYDSKADIFSLGVIGEDIFDIDINESDNNLTENKDFKEKLIDLTQLIISMTEHLIIRRPSTCAEVLAQYKDLSLSLDELKSFPEYQELAEKVTKSNVNIFIDYSKRVIDYTSKPLPDLISTVDVDSGIESNINTTENQVIESTPEPTPLPPAPVVNNDDGKLRLEKKIVREVENIGKSVKHFFNKI